MKILRLLPALLGAAASLGAQTVEFSAPAAGQVLEAGQVVEVRWSGVPAGVDELELLLVAGPNRPFTLRLTSELDPATRTFRWTVPNLRMPEAKLLIRMNLDEREIESVPSPPFSIESSPASAMASLELRAGEMWIEPSATDPRPDRDPFHGDMRTVAESFEAPLQSPSALPAAAPVPDPRRSAENTTVTAPRIALARSVLLSSAPRSVPRRI